MNSAGLPRVSVVIPIHNGRDHTLACLESLERSSYAAFEIVVVDDGSTDGSAAAIAARFPSVRVLQGDGELWWTGAVNLAVDDVLPRGADYVLTLNHDTIVDPELIARSVECAERHGGRALVGAKIYEHGDPDKVWFFGSRLDPATGDVVQTTGRDEDFTEEAHAQALTGMGCLIPARVFTEVGRYDRATFPHYMADIDFTLRAGQRGFELVVNPASTLYADVGSSWTEREFAKRELKLLPQLLLLERSPFNLSLRSRWNRRYFPQRWIRTLVRYYVSLARVVLVPHAVFSLARLPGRLVSRARG